MTKLFKVKEIGVQFAEAKRCIEEFIPALKSNIESGKEMKELYDHVADQYGEDAIVDVISFRIGMYALAIAQEGLRSAKDREGKKVRFIV